MKWLTQWKVGPRLVAAFVIGACGGAGIGLSGLYDMHRIAGNGERLHDRELAGLAAAQGIAMLDLRADSALGHAVARSGAAAADTAAIDRHLVEARHALDEARNRVGQLAPLFDAGERDQLDRLVALQARADAAVTAIEAELRAGDRRAASHLANDIAPLVAEAAELSASLVQTKLRAADAIKAASDAQLSTALQRLALLILLGLGGGVAAGVVIARSVTGPLDRALAASDAMAAGDLTRPFVPEGRDEVAALVGSLETMRRKTAEVCGVVSSGADAVATSSAQVSAGTLELSSRTESQASTLEETSASIDVFSSTVKQTADNASQANQLAMSASGIAAQGGEMMEKVVATMGDIAASSQQIAKIVGVIDDIAFQTNLLALNAAVEAARAGEQGKGFAVVASEVRMLAQRSATAAREIKQLIASSAERVEEGSALVDRAGQTMTDIVTSIQRVADIVNEISAASRDQAGNIGQINSAVAQMDTHTQQNAALVEQTSAATQSMQEQAAHLLATAGFFRV
ncbi:methyl-accepting chemotaxis protein [Derxia lacustris]|uniref:methyl-accepting chemotaxis protein n=1 Tax=Derxia lacustris TaxID=764842 RepID=UPI000A17093B|nr:methyl-accepting chemotaxis protein [Derxia lacustris]